MTEKDDSRKVSILYVDDDPENLEGFRAVFRREYNVHLADSARKALEILDRRQIHVLITDQRMPEMTGSELLEAASDRNPDMIRFMLTGFSDFNPLVDAINRGNLQGFFTKPIDVSLIRDRIEQSLAAYYLKMKNEDLRRSLRRKEARLRSIFDQAAVGIAVIEKNSRFGMVNKKLCDMMCLSEAELLGMSLHEALDHDDVIPGGERLKALAENRIPRIYIESRVCRSDNERKWISVTLSAIRSGGQGEDAFIAIAEDITRRKAAKKEKERLLDRLQQARRMEAVGTLAGGIAHDFNNILSPIVGYSEMITAAAPESRNGEYARRILKAGFRARDLISQILTLSREGKEEKRPVKIQPVVKEALKLLRASLPVTVVLIQRIDPDCGPVMGDSTQIYQVIVNLCTNAYQAIQNRGGRLEVAVEEIVITDEDRSRFMDIGPGQFVRISVSDSGPGIDPAIMERIFEPYFTTKQMKHGTGLGLSVVHGIVRNHGGAVRVSSEPGRETKFSVYLPLLPDEDTETSPAAVRSAPGGSESILLVDNREDIVDVVREILEQLGYTVAGFTDSREALRHFREKPDAYDLIISDMTMPRQTGPEFAREVLSVKPDIPVLICTGGSERISREKAAEAGIRGIIMKPIIRTEIAQKLREILEGD